MACCLLPLVRRKTGYPSCPGHSSPLNVRFSGCSSLGSGQLGAIHLLGVCLPLGENPECAGFLESPGASWLVKEEGLGDYWGLCLFWTQQGLFLGWQMEVAVAVAGIIRQQPCGLRV
jgi:hypothetical protein